MSKKELLTIETIKEIKEFLFNCAESIEDEATREHIRNLHDEAKLRDIYLAKVREDHIQIIRELSKHIDKDPNDTLEFFNKLGIQLARKSIQYKLHIQETVNGSIYLKQAIWKKLDENGYIQKLTSEEIYKLNQTIGTYIDTLASRLIFTYYETDHQHLYDIFMQAPAVIAVLKGPDHVMELANDLFLQLVNKDQSIIGKPVRATHPEAEGQGFFELLDQVYTTGKPFIGKEIPATLNRGKDNTTTVYLNFVYQPLLNTHGDVQGIFVHAIDVTEHVTTKQQLEKIASEREKESSRLEFGQKAGRIGTYEWNLVNNDSVWTKELEALYGFPEDELPTNDTETWFRYIHPEDRNYIEKRMEQAIKKDSELNTEYRVIWPDQTIHYLANRAKIVRDDNGKALQMIGVNIDITERKTIENNLAYLSEASKVLASSLDYKTTLANVAKLAVPAIADWCSVTIKNGDNLEELAVAHIDPKKIKWAKELRKKYPVDPNASTGIPKILKTGKSELYPYVTQEMIEASTRTDAEREIINKLQMSSVMMVPLLLGGNTIGVISFIASESGRHYTKNDLKMAEDIARRMALAIENARLYAEAKNADEIQKRLASIVESSDDAIISANIDGKITSWNKGAQQLYGYTPDEIMGRPIAILAPPGKKDDSPAIIKLLEKGEKVEHYETKRKAKNGKIIDVALTVSPIRNKEGTIIGTSKIARDITGRKRDERRQKFLEEAGVILGSSIDYETTLKNVSKLIIPYLADYSRIVVLDNDNHLKEVSVTHSSPRKQALVHKLYEAYKDMTDDEYGIGRLINSGQSELMTEVKTANFDNIKPKVKELVEQLGLKSYMGVPMKIGTRIIGAMTFSSTQTDRLYTKEDVELAEELARRAALAIENARLYAESQKAVTLRDEFISVASHELKTPVTSLKMYTQGLQRQFEKSGEEATIRYLNRMNNQIDKMIVLISDLLDVSKMQLGKLDFNFEVFDINKLTQEVVESVQSTSQKHTIQINGKANKKIYGDKERIGQVISNLLTNAIKYSPQADKIIVNLVNSKKNIEISVQDFGIGINKEHQKKIFERFYRVTSPEEKTFPGLGIGLYICSEIIQRHNGRMFVSSQKGKGSKFSFTLPTE